MKIITRSVAIGDRMGTMPIGIELTRRNLLALLVKLDESGSACTIIGEGFRVTAVEDEAHYSDREPGPMTPVTEATIKRDWRGSLRGMKV